MVNISINPEFKRQRDKAMKDLYDKFRGAEQVRKEMKEMDENVAKKGPKQTYQLLLNRYNNTNDTYLKDILRDELRLLRDNL